MIRANCSNKFTSFCTGHCDTCINGNTFGQPAVEQTELLQETFNKGYARGRKETAKEIYKAVLDLRELMVNNDDALCILRNVESWAKEDGVEVEE